VTVAWEGLDVIDVQPNVVADVWAERPLVVHARYRTPGRGRAVLTGTQGGRPYRQELAVTLPEREDDHAAIASMWARAKIEALTSEDLGALQRGAFPVPLKEEIVSVALSHRILTEFTSFVAVEERVVNEGGEQRTVRVPVEMPDGVRYEGVFGREVSRAKSAARVAAAPGMSLALLASPAAPPPAAEARPGER